MPAVHKESPDAWITLNEASRRLGGSMLKVTLLALRGELEYKGVGRSHFISRASVERFEQAVAKAA